MGASDSRSKNIGNKLSITSIIKQEFNCPFCSKKFTEKITFIQLNRHLNKCGNNNNSSNKNETTSKRIELSFDNDTNINSHNKNNKIKAPLRKYSSVILEEISKNKKLNFKSIKEKKHEMNNSLNIQKEEEKEKENEKNGTLGERYNKMKEYFILKKNQYKTEAIITGENIYQLLVRLKSCNIYQKLVMIMDKEGKEEKYSLKDIVFQYFDLMIKSKNIDIINGKTISLSLNQKIDFELFGYNLAILLIYPEYKLNYKIPQLICKLLINEKLTLNDIQYENKLLYDYLIKLKKENDISYLNIYFNCQGKELIQNGNQIKVDEYNYEEYIDKMIEYEINKYIKKVAIIQDSVFSYVPKNYIMNFKGEELYQIFNRLV